MSDDQEKLTPFTSKANEIARNFALVSDTLISNSQVLAQLNGIMVDLIILADELDLEEGEIEHIASIVQDGMEKVKKIHTQMALSDKEVRDCIVDLFGPKGLEPFMDRKVVNPYDPIFTYKESSMSSSKLAKRIALKFAGDHVPETSLKDELIRLGSKNPELREHIRPVLTKISSDRPAGDVYPEWHSSWGGEPRELPKAGSIRAFMPLSQTLDAEHFREEAEHYGAIINQEKDKGNGRTYFQVWMRDKKGTIFGYHYESTRVEGIGFRSVEFIRMSL